MWLAGDALVAREYAAMCSGLQGLFGIRPKFAMEIPM
jgi:hypothetical protein